jgi:hypothetical protein
MEPRDPPGRFLCSTRGRAFVRSTHERSDMGRGPSAHAQFFFPVWLGFLFSGFVFCVFSFCFLERVFMVF